jgi:hypothetical protein
MKTGTSPMTNGKNSDLIRTDMCRFVMNPFPECYCSKLSSKNIPNIITFCGDDFESCPIYSQKAIKSRLE